MSIDKTKNHFHLDIRHIDQEPHGLNLGQFVYQDESGIYKLAISDSDLRKSNVQGVIWGILNNSFYLKTSYGPLKYREPFGPDFYNKDEDGKVIEDSPNIELLPGDLGCKLWLSEAVLGGVQTEESNILLGYKTNYGMLYRPEYIMCKKPPTV